MAGLILSRRSGERILIGDDIVITVTEINRGQVKIGVIAPKSVPVHRKEVRERIKQEKRNVTVTD